MPIPAAEIKARIKLPEITEKLFFKLRENPVKITPQTIEHWRRAITVHRYSPT